MKRSLHPCRCWGTLSCGLIVHPSVERENPEAVDKAIAGLRYGSICVNAPCSMGFAITPLTWGAFPGNTPQVYLCLMRWNDG